MLGEQFCMVCTTSVTPLEVMASIPAEEFGLPGKSALRGNSIADKSGKLVCFARAGRYRWFRVGGLDYILKRRAV